MKMNKTATWAIVITVFGLMLCSSVVFLLACSVPAEYKPIQLTQKERKLFAKDFVDRHGLAFLNKVQENQAFTHTISQDELNLYLASLDEIAFLKPGRDRKSKTTGGIYEAMDKAGLADPVIRMHDGVFTIMVRTRGSNKVVALDISMKITDDDRLAVALEHARIGLMPMPQALLDKSITSLKRAVAKKSQASEASARDLDGLLSTVLASINEDPIGTELKFSRKRIRKITELTIEDGKLIMRVVPVDYKSRQAE